MSIIINIENLSFNINKRKIFSEISFEIKKKDLIAIIGPNGSGKTSLIKMLLGFNRQSFGSINHYGKKLYGYVPQNFFSLESMVLSVGHFLKFTEINNLSIARSVEITKIENLLECDLDSLSGGELRKVLLAKALLSCKEILFLDEPTCWLDSNSQKEFYELIQNLNKELDCAIVLISHDPILKKEFFSKIVSMNKAVCC